MDDVYICCKCNERLILQAVSFFYLGRDFSSEVLKCPVCGQVYIPESTVNEKISAVEQTLECK